MSCRAGHALLPAARTGAWRGPKYPHFMLLDALTRDRGVLLVGASHAWAPLFERLEAGEPLGMGVFGASVAQNGGCLDQPYKRCMRYDGRQEIDLAYGPKRPFAGFAVRLLRHINATWPHAGHRIHNAALDATPAQNALPCLFSHLPARVDLVILEFGSMAQKLELTVIEAYVRALLAMRPRPLLLILSVRGAPTLARCARSAPVVLARTPCQLLQVHEWCSLRVRPRRLYRVGERMVGTFGRRDSGPIMPTGAFPWAASTASARVQLPLWMC